MILKRLKGIWTLQILGGPGSQLGFNFTFIGKTHTHTHTRFQIWPCISLESGESNGNPLQFSCLENPMDRRAWWAAVHGRKESDTTEWLPFHFSLSCVGEGNGNPLLYSCLENPRDRGAWWAAVYGITQSRTRLKRLSSSSSLESFWAVSTNSSEEKADKASSLDISLKQDNKFPILP